MVSREFLDYRPQEWATPAIDGDGVVYVGSSAARFEAIRVVDGRVLWSVATGGAVSSGTLLGPGTGAVYFGADDGRMYAVDAKTGHIKWRYATQGTINQVPALADGILLFTSSEGRIYAVDAATGAWRWQYDREAPEGFTIQGYAGVTTRGNIAYTGFSDGTLVALKTSSGDVVWTRSLSAGKSQFVDVDTTPVLLGDTLFAASYASGIYAISADTGSIAWHHTVEGASRVTVHRHRLYFTAPKAGLVCMDLGGRQRWQQAMPHGVPSIPVAVGPYLFLTGTESGLFSVSARTGELLQYFNPGHGISAPPAANGGTLAVLSNEGWLYVFQMRGPKATL
jgi:outer membrane protein assembly factor BamB